MPLRNRVAGTVAGRLGSLVLLEHRSRRSGVVRRTPVRAFRRGDTVAIGINFEHRSDWVRKVLAAKACAMRGRCLELVEPRIVPLADAAWVFPWWFRTGLRRLVRTEECPVLTVLAF